MGSAGKTQSAREVPDQRPRHSFSLTGSPPPRPLSPTSVRMQFRDSCSGSCTPGWGFYLLTHRMKEALRVSLSPAWDPHRSVSFLCSLAPALFPLALPLPEAACQLPPSGLPRRWVQTSQPCCLCLPRLVISFHYQALHERHVAPENKTGKRKPWWGGAAGSGVQGRERGRRERERDREREGEREGERGRFPLVLLSVLVFDVASLWRSLYRPPTALCPVWLAFSVIASSPSNCSTLFGSLPG